MIFLFLFFLFARSLCPPSLRRELNERAELRGARPSKGRREKSSQPLFLPPSRLFIVLRYFPRLLSVFFAPSPVVVVALGRSRARDTVRAAF